jgi:hypothetical protein
LSRRQEVRRLEMERKMKRRIGLETRVLEKKCRKEHHDDVR